jgi:Zn-dependent M28 family amino/carboxypeptidase
MRSIAYVIISCVFAACSPAEAGPQFDQQTALQYVERQLAFGPRVPNTEAHRQTGDWILERLQATADTIEVQEFTHVTVDDDTLALRNFIGRFRPEATERVLLLAHGDSRPYSEKAQNLGDRDLPVPGANDGASGVAVLLAVADQLALEPPIYGVDLLFVDGEDYGDFIEDKDVLLGSRYFAANLPEGYQPLFAVLFDMVGDRDLRIQQEWHSAQRAPEVVERVWRRADQLGHDDVFVDQVGAAVTDDHLPLLDAGIRAINVIDFEYPYHHTPQDTLDKVSAESLRIVGEVALALVR